MEQEELDFIKNAMVDKVNKILQEIVNNNNIAITKTNKKETKKGEN